MAQLFSFDETTPPHHSKLEAFYPYISYTLLSTDIKRGRGKLSTLRSPIVCAHCMFCEQDDFRLCGCPVWIRFRFVCVGSYMNGFGVDHPVSVQPFDPATTSCWHIKYSEFLTVDGRPL